MSQDGTPRRPGGRSARVRRAVLDAALDVLHAHGMEGLAVTDVAARAGVHETSIYRRWGTREHLIVDALLEEAEEHLEMVKELRSEKEYDENSDTRDSRVDPDSD